MGMLDGFRRLLGGAEIDAEEALRQAYRDATERLELIQGSAAAAPQQASERELQRIAELGAAQVEQLATALRQRKMVVPRAKSAPADPALNHWGRLVRDLERHRHAGRTLHDRWIRFNEDDGSLAALFHQLKESCEEQCRALRTLIARADPQALP